jgi:hypothetical protein
MPRPAVTREQKDSTRLGNLIVKFADRYFSDPHYKEMINSTVFFTEQEIQDSQRIVGGTLIKGDYGQNN